MTVTCPTVTVVAVPSPTVLTADSVVISAPTCIEPCGVNVAVTWHNVSGAPLTGETIGITVDGITPSGGIVTGVGFALDERKTYNFTVTGLTVLGSPHNICPVPN